MSESAYSAAAAVYGMLVRSVPWGGRPQSGSAASATPLVQLWPAGGAFANVAAPAAPAKATETADKTLAAQPDSKSADEDPLLKNKKKAQLVRTVSRVTVILPKK